MYLTLLHLGRLAMPVGRKLLVDDLLAGLLERLLRHGCSSYASVERIKGLLLTYANYVCGCLEVFGAVYASGRRKLAGDAASAVAAAAAAVEANSTHRTHRTAVNDTQCDPAAAPRLGARSHKALQCCVAHGACVRCPIAHRPIARSARGSAAAVAQSAHPFVCH